MTRPDTDEDIPLQSSTRTNAAIHGSVVNGGHYGTARRKASTVCDFNPVTLSWEQLHVRAMKTTAKQDGSSKQGKSILRGVTGIAQPGTLTAIMGSSGAGKTTLLHALNNRLQGCEVTDGCIHINGRPIDASVAKISGYVQQDDMFMSCLTVREHLEFHVLLRMDPDITHKTRYRRVEEVIRALGLTKCADTRIGDPQRGVKGISGGERKRLSLASELLTNPPLMLCDEPTSGLDSFMAQNTVRMLRELATEGRTVLATIHQPSSEVFRLFDRVLLLSNGRTSFLGDVRAALNFLADNGYNCPKNYNPADFIVETLAIPPGMETECQEKVKDINDAFERSATSKDMLRQIEDVKPEEAPEGVDSSPYKASWWEQMKACTWRSGLVSSREPFLTTTYLIKCLVMAGVISATFFQTPLSQDGIQNINGCIFLLVTMTSYSFTLQQCKVFPVELSLMRREHFNGMYRVDVFLLAKFVTDLPFVQLFLPAMIITIVYWSVGLYPAIHNFVVSLLLMIALANVSVSFGE